MVQTFSNIDFVSLWADLPRGKVVLVQTVEV